MIVLHMDKAVGGGTVVETVGLLREGGLGVMSGQKKCGCLYVQELWIVTADVAELFDLGKSSRNDPCWPSDEGTWRGGAGENRPYGSFSSETGVVGMGWRHVEYH